MISMNKPVYTAGTKADRLALAIPPASENHTIIYWTETDTATFGDEYALIFGSWKQTKVAGVALVSIGAVGTIKDRQATAIGTVQASFTWPVNYGPRALRVRLRGGSTGDAVNLVFDAPTAGIATDWLADNGSASLPRMHRVLHNVDTADANSVGDGGWTEINFSAPLQNLYYVGVGTLSTGTVLEVEGE